MTPARIVFAVGIVLALAGVGTLLMRSVSPNSASDERSLSTSETSGAKKRQSAFNRLVAAKMDIQQSSSLAKTAEKKLSPVCQKSLETLLDHHPLQEVLKTLESMSAESFGETCGFDGDGIVKKYRETESVCEKIQREEVAGEAAAQCWQAFLKLRATVVRARTKGISLAEITDANIVANLAIDALFDNRMPEFSLAAERLFELVPDEPEVANTLVAARFITASSETSPPSTEPWKRFDEVLTRARAMQTGDALVRLATLELGSLRVRNATTEAFEKRATELLAEFPELLPEAEYIRASVELDTGKKAESIARLERLVAEHPNNERFKGTLRQVQQGVAKAFSLSMNFDLPQMRSE
jgi:hypothetical protein